MHTLRHFEHTLTLIRPFGANTHANRNASDVPCSYLGCSYPRAHSCTSCLLQMYIFRLEWTNASVCLNVIYMCRHVGSEEASVPWWLGRWVLAWASAGSHVFHVCRVRDHIHSNASLVWSRMGSVAAKLMGYHECVVIWRVHVCAMQKPRVCKCMNAG